MELEFQQAAGKSAGEVMRDVAAFLATPCIIHKTQDLDLRYLPNQMSMAEQLSFALLSEAEAQGWSAEAAESFYRSACADSVDAEVISNLLSAFGHKESKAYITYRKQYGNRFRLLDTSYWACCLALAIDAGQIGEVLRYLRLFIVVLTEFAYMGDRNPSSTYVWTYYESFQAILDELTAEPDPDPVALKVRAVGGTAGKREGDAYPLSLGVDIENPNEGYMALGIAIDVTLKDKNGNVIDVITDKLDCMDPAVIYHYGITKKIKGAAVASISAVVKARQYIKLSTPIMNHVFLDSVAISGKGSESELMGILESKYDCPLRTLTLHYQFLSAENKILGGGSEWCFDGLSDKEPLLFSSKIGMTFPDSARVVYSVNFNALELIED